MNLVVFGGDTYTAAVVESLMKAGHTVSVIIAPESSTVNYKVLEDTAAKSGIGFSRAGDVNSADIKEKIKEIKPDLIITAHLRRILKKEIFSLAAKGAINIHPSLLPKYRGLSPQHQAIMHGDEESGVTVHYIDEDADTGDIILQRKFSIAKDDYIMHVQAKMLNIYKSIIVDALQLLDDESFKPWKQDLSELSYFGPLKKRDYEIDLSKSRTEIYNLIRAVSLPYKGAYFKNYRVWKTEISEPAGNLRDKYSVIGLYYDEETERIIINLKDGILVSEDFEIN